MSTAPSAYHQAARTRVERILGGVYQSEDFTRLLLYLRARSYGRQAIVEAGDFVAHADERAKGIVTDSVRDFFYFVRVRLPHPEKQLHAQALPPYFPDLLRANARRLDDGTLKNGLGMKRKAVQDLVKSVNSKLTKNPDGTWKLSTATADEARVADFLKNIMVCQPAFDGERLFKEFCEALVKNKLADPQEVGRLAGARVPLCLHAVANMHQCRIDLGDGTFAVLSAHKASDGQIEVGAAVDMDVDGYTLALVSPIFTTSLQALDWCEPELSASGNSWEFPVEINQHGRLARLA